MKIELRRITHNARLSQETEAFAADIYVDGVKRGSVMNDGQGGPDRIHPHTLGTEIDTYAKTLPSVPSKFSDEPLPMCAELLIGDLLHKHLVAKDMARAMKGKTLFTKADGKFYTIKGTATPKDAVAILNTMPHDEALALFMKGQDP